MDISRSATPSKPIQINGGMETVETHQKGLSVLSDVRMSDIANINSEMRKDDTMVLG